MTIKLVTLKSGEDVICDLSEVSIPHENEDLEKLVDYSMNLPYVVKLANPQTLYEAVESQKFHRSLSSLGNHLRQILIF